jgi:hypothetical protein
LRWQETFDSCQAHFPAGARRFYIRRTGRWYVQTMNTYSTPRRLLLGLALIVGLAGLSAALLNTPSAAAKGGQKAARGGLLKVAADYVGVTPAQLVTELRQGGKSLADVAVAHGKTRAGLKQALKTSITTRIQASKRLSAEQKAKVLAGLDGWLDKVVDHKGAQRAGPRPGGAGKVGHRGGLLKAVADYTGLTNQQLVTKLRAGQSLAQVAVAQGKTVAGLKQAILAPVKTRLNKLVTDKRITPAQRDQALARFEKRLDTLVNRSFKPRR